MMHPSIQGTRENLTEARGLCAASIPMTYNDTLALAAQFADDPDDWLDIVNQLLTIRWADGTPLVDR